MILQLTLVLLVLGYSVANLVLGSPLPNFSPMLALVFACAVAFSGRRSWALPLGAWLLLSVVSSQVYGYPIWQGTWLTGICYAAIFCIGYAARPISSNAGRFLLSLTAPLLFFVVTNGASFLADPRYAKGFSGLLQAYWTGLPSDVVPTWVFFRNSLLANGAFSACFFFLASPVAGKARNAVEQSAPTTSPH